MEKDKIRQTVATVAPPLAMMTLGPPLESRTTPAAPITVPSE